jgi:hypothetical protein
VSTVATYSFLPWMRQGLAGQITAPDLDTTAAARVGVEVRLRITADSASGDASPGVDVDKTVQLYGPGDVVGIDPRAVVRTYPRDWITDAEPNYLAHVEFYDEDLPWRYTPAAPDTTGLQLRPWIALVVLEEDVEFREVHAHADRPLRSVEVTEPAALPPAGELWAWAHVHVNASLAAAAELVQGDTAQVAARLAAAAAADRDVAYSRLVCPRRLKPGTRYHAFVVPTFETGRLAGLGLDPATAPHATASAWADYPGRPAGATLPFYHRWYFRTGDQGDFEYLVRLLQARPIDARVGVRDVDVRQPGSGIRGVTDPAFGGVLKLGGALRVPRAALSEEERAVAERYEHWDQQPPAAAPYPQDIQRDLAAFVNLPDDYAAVPAGDANTASGVAEPDDPDPLVTAPLYGRWHALTQRLLKDRDGTSADPNDNWVHELNLDPRHRLAAGFGTRAVQAGQERYMDAAWGQVGDVIEANRRIRLAQLAALVARSWWLRQLTPQVKTAPERLLRLTAPAHRHVLLPDAAPLPASPAGASTLRNRFTISAMSPALVSTPMRRVTRPGHRLDRMLPYGEETTRNTVLRRVDAGQVSAAPAKVTPPGVVTTDEIADTVGPGPLPAWIPGPIAAWLLRLLRRNRRLPWLVLAAALVLLVVAVVLLGAGAAVAAGLVAVAAVVLVVLWWALRRSAAVLDAADGLRPGSLTVAAVDALPAAPGFVLTAPGEPAPPAPAGATGDSATAVRFKSALRDWARLHEASVVVDRAPRPVRYGEAGLASLATGALVAVDPEVTVRRRVLAGVTLPARITEAMVEEFGEVMYYPRIDQPMYEPLRDQSDEHLLPNLNLIPPNTISLLETNQPFIEAYMVGVNHEMARELLWREYPTDQRGTPFRQFWDVSGARPETGQAPEQARESLLDIPELHRWARRSALGDHDHREPPGADEQEAVLVIRGDLLKKYPTAIIYAHKARWDTADGHADPSKERVLEPLTPDQDADPPTDLVKTPLYEARVFPDITFFGFDLTVEQAVGEPGTEPGHDAGWFFCIKERPGEPRFGFDVEGEAQPETVNDLTWSHVGTSEGGLVAASALATITLGDLEPDDTEKVEQRADDEQVVAAPVSAARWAYLAYQAPVLVAVHAAEMLRREGT